MSKNLAEPSTQRIIAGQSYRISQLERRPVANRYSHVDWAYAEAVFSATITAGNHTDMTDFDLVTTSNPELFELFTGGGGHDIITAPQQSGLFLTRAAMSTGGGVLSGTAKKFKITVGSTDAEGLGGQYSMPSDNSGFYDQALGLVPGIMRTINIHRLIAPNTGIIQIEWWFRVDNVGANTLTITNASCYLEVMKLGDFYEETQLWP